MMTVDKELITNEESKELNELWEKIESGLYDSPRLKKIHVFLGYERECMRFGKVVHITSISRKLQKDEKGFFIVDHGYKTRLVVERRTWHFNDGTGKTYVDEHITLGRQD